MPLQFDQKVRPLSFRPEKIDLFTATHTVCCSENVPHTDCELIEAKLCELMEKMNSICSGVLAIKGSNRNQESVLKTEVVEIKDSVKANMPTLKSAFCSKLGVQPTITDMKRSGKFNAQRKRPRTFLVTFSNAWDARSLLANLIY